MRKQCSICGRAAAYAVIDKVGFMNPGTLCPIDYLKWKKRPGSDWFIFQIIQGGEFVMRQFLKERGLKYKAGKDQEVAIDLERSAKTMKEIKFDAVMAAYESNGQNAEAACRELKISKATFYRELRRNDTRVERKMKTKNKLRTGG